jgi:hypothetical protein
MGQSIYVNGDGGDGEIQVDGQTVVIIGSKAVVSPGPLANLGNSQGAISYQVIRQGATIASGYLSGNGYIAIPD